MLTLRRSPERGDWYHNVRGPKYFYTSITC